MKKQLRFCIAILVNVICVLSVHISAFAQCVTPSLTSASTGGAICTGSMLNLFANGPVNVTGYSWTGPNSFTSTLQNPSIASAGTAGAGVYTVLVVNGTGTCSATYTVSATINASPVSSYVISQDPVCIGTQVVLSPATAWCNPFALDCNGVNSSASSAAPVSTAIDNVTIEGWVQWNGGGNEIILSNGNSASDGYSLQIVDGSGTLYIVLGGVTYLSSSVQLTLGVRQHVAIERNAGTWSIYVNGIQYPVANATTTPNTPTTGFFIGNNGDGTNPFGGYIENVAFWTTARSTAQIQADMNSCSLSPQTGLAGYWGLGDGSGTSITDASGNGNTLTLAHTTWHSTLLSGAYTWNFGDGSSSVTGSAPAHTYTASATYTVSITSSSCSGSASKTVTVSPYLSGGVISGTLLICADATATLSDVTTSGVWSSTNSAAATVSSAGVVTGVAAGTSVISYTVTNVCGSAAATSVATINAQPVTGTITGANTVCTGANITLSDAAGGGVWSSGNTAAATISSSGTVTGIGGGIATISYTVTTGFCTLSATTVVTVSAAASAGTISGATNVCAGVSTPLFDGVSGGVWNSSNTSVANIDGAGNLSGVAGGTVTISYSVATCDTAVTTMVVTVNVLPSVSFTAQAEPPLCTNTSVTYTTQTGEHDYAWSVDGTVGTDYTIVSGGTDTGSNSVTLQWIIPGNRNVSVNYTDGNGCTSGVNNNTTISGAPVSTYIVAPGLACTGTPISFIPEAGAWCNSLALNFSPFTGGVDGSLISVYDNLTVEAWIQPTGGSYWSYAVENYQGYCVFVNGSDGPSYNSGFGLFINGSGALEIRLPGVQRLSSSAYIPFDQKSHVAVVRNAGIWSIYLNGVQYGVSNNSAGPYICRTGECSEAMWIGRTQSPYDTYLGLISNMAFWTMPRSTAQIQGDMNSCSLSPQSGLAAFWPFDGNGNDLSENGRNLYIGGEEYAATYSASEYLWDFGDGDIAVGGAPWHTYSAPGYYNINVTSELCPGSSSTSVIILDTLPAIGVISGTTGVCQGVTVTLSDNIVAGGVWSSSNPSIATVDGSGNVTSVVTGTATISYSLSNVCGIAAATAIMTVNTAPTVTFTTTPPASSCLNTPVTYTTQPGETSYTWNIEGTEGTDYTVTAGGIGSSSNSVTLEWLSPGSKTVTVNYTAGGCVSPTAASVATIVSATPSYAVSPNPVCVGNATTFTGTSTCNSSVLNFNGSNSMGSIGTPISTATNNITIEASVLWNGGANQTIFLNGNAGNSGYGLNVSNTSGQLIIMMGGVVFATSSATLTAGVAAHVAIVRNAGTWSIYVNGVPYSISSPTATPNTPGTGFFVGSSGGGSNSFNGIISNVAFWTVARSTSQIVADIDSCTISAQTGLAGYWVLGEGSGTTANDLSGNGNNMALTNTTWIATPSSYSNELYASYSWVFGDGGTSTLNNPVHTYTASGTFTSSLTATNMSGCALTASKIVTVNATPPSDGTILGTPTVCIDYVTYLSDPTAAGGGVWSSGSAGIATVGSTTGVVTGVATGTALISYTVSNGCTASATAIVTVSTTNPVFTTTPAAQICQNGSATYTALSGQYNYTWTIPGVSGTDYTITAGGTGSSSNSVTLTWLTTGSKTVTVDYTSTNGCTGASVASNTITVNALPVANFVAAPNPGCLGSTITFVPNDLCNLPLLNFNGSSSSVSIGTPVSIATDNITIEAWVQWNGGSNQCIFLNGNVGSSGYGLHIFNGSGQMEILMGGVVFATSAATLTAGTKEYVAIVRNAGTWSIYVNGVPYAISSPTATPNTPNTGFFIGRTENGGLVFNGTISNVSFWNMARSTAQILADMTICTMSARSELVGYWTLGEGSGTVANDLSGDGHNLSLSNTTWSTPLSISSYSWSFGDGSTSTATSPGYTYSVAGTYTSSLTLTNTAGCSNTAATTIVLNVTPNAGTITGSSAVCLGSALSLSNATTGGTWSSSNPTIATVNTSGVVTSEAAGTTTISYSVSNGCGTVAATIVVTVTAVPTATFTTAPPASYCRNTPVTYTTQTGETNYVWTVQGTAGTDYMITGGGTGSSSNSVTLEWLSAGTKTVTVNYTSAGCSSPTAAIAATIIDGLPLYSVTPNPVCLGNPTTFTSLHTCNSSALSFDGSNSTAFDGTPVSTATDNVTMEGWVLWNGGSGNQQVFANGTTSGNGYAVFITNSGTVNILLGDVVLMASSYTLTTGQRAHLAMVRNSGTWSLYVDGVQYAVSSSTSTPNTPSGGAYIGCSNVGDYFNGQISNVASWTVARSTAQIQADMNACTLYPQAGLAAYWQLNEGTGSTAIDGTGNGNNLALTNTSWVTSPSYTWSFGDGGTSTLTNATNTYTLSGTYTASLTMTNTSGCTTSATQIVTVNATPPGTGTITGTQSVCLGSSVTLSDAVTAGVWSSGSAAIATIGSNNGVVTGVALGTALISYTVSNGCVASATAIVTVNTTVIAFTTTPPAQICANTSATYATLSGQSNYAWSISGVSGTDYTITGGGTGSSSNSVTLTWLSAGTKTVTVNYTGSNGCGAASAASSIITVNALPAAGFAAVPNPVCLGSATTFTTDYSCNSSLLNFNGSNSSAFISTPISTSVDNVTMEAWVQWNGGANQFVFANGNPGANGYGLWILNSGGTLGINLGDVILLTTSATLTQGVRTHVVIERNSGTWMIYIDGVPYSVPSSGSTPITPGTGFYVGWSGAGQSFNGIISNVAFWTTARSATQIQADMLACTLSPQSGLAGYWTLGDGSGTTANDGSGHGLNLSLANTAWSATSVTSYSWSFGDGSTSTASTPAYTYSASGTYTPSLTLTSSVGCVGSATTGLVVTAGAGTITGSPVACIGTTATLSDASLGGIWTSANTSIATIGTNGVVQGVAVGTATISYSFSNSCGFYTTTVVTVNPVPAASFTVSPSSPLCSSTPATYTTQGGESNYAWTVPGVSGNDYIITAGGIGSSSNSVTLNWLTTGNKTVTVNYTNASGCTSTAASNTTSVNLAPAAVSCFATPSLVCIGTATNFKSDYSCNSSVLNFNGSSSKASIGTPISTATNNVTLEAWVQWNGGANQTIFINGNGGSSGYMLGISDASGTLQILLGGVNYLTSSAQLTSGARQHVAIVRNSGTWSVYLDGIQYSVTNATSTPNTPNTGFFVGNSNSGGNSLNGTISNVAFWTVVRSTAQIQADMGSCTPSPQTGLAGYWALGEGSGTTGNDASGNGHNLALSGTTWSTPSGYNYTWSFGDGGTSTQSTPAYTYTASGTYTSSLTVTNTVGCGSTATTIVTVNTTPATGTITGVSSFCASSGTTLSDAVTGGIWSSGNTGFATVGSTSGIVTGVAPGTATISYTVNNGCTAFTTTTVTLNTTTPVFTSVPATSICVNGSATYTALSGQSNYVWTISGVSGTDYNITAGGTGSSSNSVTLTWLTVSNKTVTVNYTGTNGCPGLTPASTITTLNALPSVTYVASPDPLCLGSAATFASNTSCNTSVVNFNGSNSFASWGAPISTAVDNITIEASVLWNGGANQAIFLNGNPGNSGYGLYIDNAGGQLEILMGDVVFATSSATLTAGVRSSVAIVRNAGTWSVYVNGAPYSISSPTATPITPGTGFFVGSNIGGTNSFNGIISNVAFWTVARSTAQILFDVSNCTISPQTGLAGYWTFGEGSGSITNDESGNGHSLTLNNTTWSAPPPSYSSESYTTYAWSFGDGNTSTLVNPSYTYTASGTYTSSLTATNSLGCAGTAAVIVTVNTTPAAGSLTGTPAVCIGLTTSLTDAVTGGTWSSSNTGVATVATTGIVSGLAGGTANISYTLNNGCVAVATSQVTVNTATPSFTATPTAANCINVPLTYTTQSGQSNYVWTVGGTSGTDYTVTAGGTGSSSNSVTLNWLTAGDKTVTVNYTTSAGCTGAAAAANSTLIANIYPNPAYSVNPSPACTGAATTFSAIATSTAGGWCSDYAIQMSSYNGYYLYTNSGVYYNNYSSTFEAWVNWQGSTDGQDQGILCYGADSYPFGLSVEASGALQVEFFNTSGSYISLVSSAQLPVNVLTHIALEYTQGTGWTVYVNGVPYALPTSQILYNSYSYDAVNVGYDEISYDVFNGMMANVAFWIDARTTLQVNADMNSCTPVTLTRLAGYWPLNEGSGWQANDLSSSNNPLYLSDPSMWVSTGGSLNSYAWSFGDGDTASGLTPVHTYSVAGVYTSSVIATSTGGCSSAVTEVVTINTAPALSGTSAGLVCVGGTLSLFAGTPSNVTGYSWAGPNSFNATNQNPSISSAATNATGTYTVTAYDGGPGCATSYTIAATVSPVPALASAFAHSLVCIGTTMTLTADTPSHVTGYLWTGPDSFSATGASPSISSVTTAASGVYSVTVYNGTGSGCIASYTTVPVQVITIPVIGIITGSVTTCAGGESTLSDTTAGGFWFSTDPTIADVDDTGMVSGISSGVVDIGYAADNMCGINERFTSFTVTSGPPAISGVNSICAGGSAILSDATAGGSWSSSDNTIATVNGSTGNVTGVAAGVATITYTLGSCGVTTQLTVNTTASVSSINGIAIVCTGATTSLTDATGSGVWSSDSPGIATIGSTGVVTGEAVGTAIISYAVTSACGSGSATTVVTVNTLPDAGSVTGAATVCVSANTTLTDVMTGGAWVSVAPGIATVGSNGIVTGVSADTTTIFYTVTNSCGSANATAVVTVNPLPNAGSISGAATLCDGANTNLSDGVGGGDWSSGNESVATVGSTGVVTGAAVGTATISYTVTNGCGTANATVVVTVNTSASAGSISGIATTCTGSTTSLTDATSSGVWSSVASGIATVGSAGTVTGVTAGTTTISYSVTSSCGTAAATVVVTVNASPNAGSISGAASVCQGSTTDLTDGAGSGVWNSSNISAATVGSTGIVTGIAAGTTMISYSVTNGCGTANTTVAVTVNPLPNAGSINGTATVCQGSTTTLTDGVGSGGWSSSNTAVATIDGTGLLNGINGGTALISYTVTNGCGNAYATQVETVNPLLPSAGTITGPSGVIIGSNITLTDAVSGGAWSAGNSNATVSGGLVTGVAAGTVTISYSVTGSCGTAVATKIITVNSSSITGISGNMTVCAGTTTTLSDATAGGVWSSSNPSVATVGGTAGIVTGVATGTANITYTQGSGYASVTITVNQSPLPIQGSSSECVGTVVTLTDGIAGGTWSISNTNATIGSLGNITGITAGTSTTTYMIAEGCFTTYPNTVLANPGAITGIGVICAGGTTMLTDATSGSLSWTSSNTAIATAINSGQVTGVAAGTAVITYKITPGCIATTVVTVNTIVGAIGGNSPVCAGTTITLSDALGAGAWSSSNVSVATVGSGSGIVTGVAGGTATITYMPGAGGCKTTAAVTVNVAPPITGNMILCAGTITVLTDASAGGTWLSGNTVVATVGTSSGVVTGVTTGSAQITYSLLSGCSRVTTVNVTGSVEPISGAGAVCAGTITTVSDATTGGVWSLSSSLVASIGSASGIVTASGTYTGTTTISYASGSCVLTQVLTVNPNPTPVQGVTSVCAGTSVTLSDVTTGGTWSSAGDVAIGSTGIVTAGAAAGTGTITYTLVTGCFTTYPSTVLANPDAITGIPVVCAGSVTVLTDASSGGISWISSNTSVATIAGGSVTGIAAGTATITFKILPGNCIAVQNVTVNAVPVVTAISGPASISHATPATLSDATAGGVWTSSHVAVISLSGSTGSPVTATATATSGNSVIGYKVTNGLGCSTTVTKTITATPAPPPHGDNTTGGTSLFVGATVNLVDDVATGLWSSTDDGIATVDGNGLVTGIRPGSVNITHVVTNEQGNVTTSVTPVIVTAAPVSIILLPNPNKGTFTIKGTVGSAEDEEVILEITDVLGQVIYRNKIIAQGGRLNETITLGNTLANGMYVLNIQSGTEHKVFHFVMEK